MTGKYGQVQIDVRTDRFGIMKHEDLNRDLQMRMVRALFLFVTLIARSSETDICVIRRAHTGECHMESSEYRDIMAKVQYHHPSKGALVC